IRAPITPSARLPAANLQSPSTRAPSVMEARRHRPFVLVNMAMTADGKIASANRAIESFSSDRDQRHLLDLRATADAVLCGARTGNASGVTMGVGGPHFRRLRMARG